MRIFIHFLLVIIFISANALAVTSRYLDFDIWRSNDRSKTWTPPSVNDTLIGRASTDTISGSKTFSSQIVSTVTTGTAPLSIASTTKVDNLHVARSTLADTVTTNANLTGHITSTGNAALLGSFSSSNLLTALSDETGSGAAVFAISPAFTTPDLGTPSAVTLTNATGLPIVAGTTGTLTETRGGTNQTTYTIGDILYASASNTLSKLAIGTTSYFLNVSAGGVPQWTGISPSGTYTLGYTEVVGSTDADGVIPADNTIPQVGEGAQIMSVTVTPLNIGQKIHVQANVKAAEEANTAHSIVLALFRNGASDAVAADVINEYDAPANLTNGRLIIEHSETVSSLDPITFTLRIGGQTSGGDIVLNEGVVYTGTDIELGGTIKSWMKVTEEPY